MKPPALSIIELLEPRIAPALTVLSPLADFATLQNHSIVASGELVDAPLPNLVATIAKNPFPSSLVPGDKANVSIEIANTGAAESSGTFDLVFSLVKVADANGNPASAPTNPVIGTALTQTLNLPIGGTITVTVPVEIPEKLFTLQGESYQIIAEVKPAPDASPETSLADNTTLNSANYRLYNAFGSFGGRKNVPITYTDAANHSVTATLSGGGFGQFDPQGVGDLDKLAVYQTTPASTFTVTASETTSLGALYIDAAIGSAALGDVSVKTSFDAHGGIKTLTLGDVGDGLATRPFGIGAFSGDAAQKVTLTLGQVRDVQFTSGMPVGFFKAVNWIDADAEGDVITAPSIDTLFLTGDTTHNGAFQADLAISGSAPLGSFRLLYNDPANEPAVLLITGGGYSHFTPQRGGPAGALEVFDTSAASIVSLAALHTTTVDSVSIENAVASVALSGVVVNGDFTALAGLKSLALAGLGDSTATHMLTLGAFTDGAQKAAINLGHVRDVALTSAMPVSTLTAIEWRDTIAPAEVISAPSIDTIVITGDATHSGVFDPTLSVAGSTAFQTFKLTYLDELDQPITLTVSSGGTGKFTGVGALAISGTSALSSISLAGATVGVKTTLDSVLITNPIGSASLANVTLNGGFTAQGGIKNLVVGNVGDGIATHMISIGAYANDPTQKTTITLGKVRDTAFTSAMPISTLTAVDWLDGNASSERITVPAIDAVSITGDATHRGNFQADLTITGATKLQSFLVTGSVDSARLQIAGDVGLIRIGGLVKSQILVGVTTLPQTLAAFGAEKHRIDTFKILNTAATATAMIDSQIAAARFGTISVGKVAPASGIGRFGFIADRIASYQVGTKTAQNLTAPMIFDIRTHYAVKIV